MTLQDFRTSITNGVLPHGITKELEALWEDARGNWDTAHGIVQRMNTEDAMWIHAYLHREEGDLSNSRYWYSRTRYTMLDMSLEEEWESITDELLHR
ncbi:hypothetical protein CSA56_09455 [candidate division KSB3 bacterium]|uniref:Uncharacterized protein n=1 Tax=candidate division KSB3 bacterium TaxID=2044937 RepID=A0A2G6KE45_9BACT|nr:MAG: hypothetical protein CSA56_09455 [candidate division KSB3 bacterium]